MKSGKFNFLEPSGSLLACNGTALRLPLPYIPFSAFALPFSIKEYERGYLGLPRDFPVLRKILLPEK